MLPPLFRTDFEDGLQADGDVRDAGGPYRRTCRAWGRKTDRQPARGVNADGNGVSARSGDGLRCRNASLDHGDDVIEQPALRQARAAGGSVVGVGRLTASSEQRAAGGLRRRIARALAMAISSPAAAYYTPRLTGIQREKHYGDDAHAAAPWRRRATPGAPRRGPARLHSEKTGEDAVLSAVGVVAAAALGGGISTAARAPGNDGVAI